MFVIQRNSVRKFVERDRDREGRVVGEREKWMERKGVHCQRENSGCID